MNHIAFDGRITRDLEISTSKDGLEYTKFCVAVDRKVKKGEEKKADFIECVCFGQSASFLNKYFKKGDGIIVEGRLQSDKYKNKEGKNVTNWSVLVEEIGFPISKKSESSNTFSEPVNTDDIPF